ncbi:ribonuclease H-like domain-containing protein [Mortierella sp. GBAus27b]|nr:ribonuclease H-like domain-containing protein [Mortierella sp. GBAus27b]
MNVRAPKKQYCANACLKINVKLRGMNSQLSPSIMPVLTARPMILLGVDVSHLAPGDTVRLSIGFNGCDYSLRGVSTDSNSRIRELLKTFSRCVDVYRDGVSEGHFDEIAAVKAEYQSPEANYKPAPGLVVDMDLVHPIEFDFYLRSHASLLGTSRPAHYVVLFDENRFSPDKLQDFTISTGILHTHCFREGATSLEG